MSNKLALAARVISEGYLPARLALLQGPPEPVMGPAPPDRIRGMLLGLALEEKAAGAGLGLYMVFNSITQLTFNIHLGHATEVVALFYARGGAKALRVSGRSLNIFLLR